MSQTQWQQMALMWRPDAVDANASSSTLPFSATVNGRAVEIRPGRAWVGGFYYQLTSALTLTIPSNSQVFGRKDLIVVQADMTKSSLNLAVVAGTSAPAPAAPRPRRQAGALWEMPLYEVDVPAKDGPVTLSFRFPCTTPPSVAFPWDAEASTALLPPGSMTLDMDANENGSQGEYFNGRDGLIATRTLGRSASYTPGIANALVLPEKYRTGRWRWIAPNTVFFSARIENPYPVAFQARQSFLGITLPVPANNGTGQVLHGLLDNDAARDPALPNFVALTGRINPGASSVFFFYPSPTGTANGLDALVLFPRRGVLTISGTYEAAEFRE